MQLFFWKKERADEPTVEITEAAAAEPAIPVRRSPQDGHDMIVMEQLDEAARIFENEARHAELGTKTLKLPDWFDFELHPGGVEFREQQLRLWEEITGRDNYDPSRHEDTPEIGDCDAWRRPAFYAWGNPRIAGEQVTAMGLILLHSDIRPGSRVIEYGAGFGQNSVALARLGAKVDTVDISPGFCSAVRTQAERFEIDLQSFLGPFGFNPAGEEGVYDLILFYESFHHCFEFSTVIPQLEKMLAPGGKIILAGEPVFRDDVPPMPTEWGIRLEWQNVAVMRIRGWMELGFREHYLTRQFMNSGFMWRHHAVPGVGPANLYEFKRWTDPIPMQQWPLSPAEAQCWRGPQDGGQWSRGKSFLRLPWHHGHVELTCVCRNRSGRDVVMTLGNERLEFHLAEGERRTISLPMHGLPDQDLVIETNTDRLEHEFPEELGIFVETIRPA